MKYDTILPMMTTDFSPMFKNAGSPDERMLDFGQRIADLADQVRAGDVTVQISDSERVLLRETVLPVGRGYRDRLPGVEIIDPETGRSIGSVGSSVTAHKRLVRQGVAVDGGIHFQAPAASFSIEADSRSFEWPETINMHKAPFHDAVQLLGQAMLSLDHDN